MGCLYQLTSPGGKSYIGISSKSTEDRWAKHTEHAFGKRNAGALYAALRKYGVESFKVKTLVIADDWDYLCEIEKRAIVAFGTKSPNGYNITDGGEGTVGRIIDDEERSNISAGQKRRFENPDELEKLRKRTQAFSPELRQRIKEKATATMRTPEFRERASVKSKKQFSDPVMRKKLGDAVRAAVTPEMRAIQSERMVKVMSDPERRKAVSDATKVGMRNPETAAKVKAAAQRRSADPEWRARISASKTGKKIAPRSDIAKQRQSEGMKAAWARRKAEKLNKGETIVP